MNISTIRIKMANLTVTGALLLALVGILLPQQVVAQNYDPPGRVARIRYVQGSVSFAPAGESDWVAAVTNRPLTIGDQLWADADSRAELDAGSAVIRMNANTGISFLNLDDRTLQVQLNQGTIDLRVRRMRSGDIVEVDTPTQAFSVTESGLYRIDAGTDGTSSMVIVRKGHGQVTGAGQSYDLYSGQGGQFTGGNDSLYGQMVTVAGPDEFDRWGDSRDAQYDQSQSARYVSPDVVGYEDLDANGQWVSNQTYGNVWMPTSVQSGWAPYRDGHWVWITPWGWTWVDDAPWGYAPSHYGRWVSVNNRWGWVPGPQNVQPVYAPALVAFIGGAGFGVSISAGGGGTYPRDGYNGGNVGWFPLGPQDAYVPGYQASRGYIERVNTSNTVVRTSNITNVYNNQVTNNQVTNITYVNQSVPGAVTVVPQNVVRTSAPVARAVVPVDPKRIAAAPVAPRAAVAPTQASVLGASNASANRMARPPAAVENRTVVAKTPPPPPRASFAQQEQALAKQPGQPLAPQRVQALPARAAEAHPAVKLAPPSKPATLTASQPNGGNARPAGAPAQQPVAPQQAAQQAQQQAAQQQAEKARAQQAQQQAAQQEAEKARAQQAQQQAAQQQAQQQAAQQEAEKARAQQAQQQAAQQQAEKARAQQAQQQAAQQEAEKARAQQTQQQAAQQQAEKARAQQAQQQAAQQEAEKARAQQAQQQAAQQQAENARAQQAQQQAAQQEAEKARAQQAQQQAAQQQAENARAQQAQQQAAQQQAEKARAQQAQQQAAQQLARQPAPQQPHPQPAPEARPVPPPANQPQKAAPARPQTPEEKAREEQTKREEKTPPPQ